METGLGGGTVRRRVVAGLTDQTLSCAAKAHVVTAARYVACLHVSRAMRAACRPAGTAERGGSAAGPKPGRASFYGELAAAPQGGHVGGSYEQTTLLVQASVL